MAATDATYKEFGPLMFELFIAAHRNGAVDYELLMVNLSQKIQDANPGNARAISNDIAYDMIDNFDASLKQMLDELTAEFELLQDRPAR